MDIENKDDATLVADDTTLDNLEVDTGAADVNTEVDAEPKSLRDTIKASVAKHKDTPKDPSPARQAAAAKRNREETGKFAPGSKEALDAAAATAAAQPETVQPKVDPAPQAQAPQAPAALSKEIKAKWDNLDPEVRNEFLKREADTQKGVEQLKTRYQPIEEAVAPFRSLLQQRGLNEGDAVKQLFNWHSALANPNKDQAKQALMALAQSHGINLQTPQAQPQQGLEGQPDFTPYIQPVLDQTSQLGQRLQQIEQNLTREQTNRVNAEITKFSEGKPHFEKVRYAMGQMMHSGLATDLDDAYNKAVWALPEIRQAILDEQNSKREEELRAAAETKAQDEAKAKAEAERQRQLQTDKARKAAVSPRGSTPIGQSIPARAKGQSVRDTILETVRGTRAQV